MHVKPALIKENRVASFRLRLQYLTAPCPIELNLLDKDELGAFITVVEVYVECDAACDGRIYHVLLRGLALIHVRKDPLADKVLGVVPRRTETESFATV